MPPGKEKELEHFHMYVPVAKGKPKPDKVDIFIGLLGFGKENAVKRDELTARCVEIGLISKDAKDKDRAMRNLLKRAKLITTLLMMVMERVTIDQPERKKSNSSRIIIENARKPFLHLQERNITEQRLRILSMKE